MKNILFIVGSLRKGSFNRQMAVIAEKMLTDKANISYLNYADIPYMNQDIEFPAPKEIDRVRKAVEDADGIWIFSPEYNGNIPGVLKNLLDWLSRPLKENDWNSGTSASGKTVTISGVGGKMATHGCRRALVGVLNMMSMNLIGDEGTGASLGFDAFKTGVANFDHVTVDKLQKQADEFIVALG